jgi:hypothetical protein
LGHNAYSMQPNQPPVEDPQETPGELPEQGAELAENEYDETAEGVVEATDEGDVEEDAEEQPESTPEMAFSWEASEFVHHHKSPLWYAGLIAGVVVLAAAAVWLRLWLEIGVFIVMAIAIIVYASKPPRTLLYELSADGLHVDGKQYHFNFFRSFSVVADEEWHSIDLEPVKRLSPRVTVLFDTEDFDEIVGHLELHLPREDREPDLIERFSRYVRF